MQYGCRVSALYCIVLNWMQQQNQWNYIICQLCPVSCCFAFTISRNIYISSTAQLHFVPYRSRYTSIFAPYYIELQSSPSLCISLYAVYIHLFIFSKHELYNTASQIRSLSKQEQVFITEHSEQHWYSLFKTSDDLDFMKCRSFSSTLRARHSCLPSITDDKRRLCRRLYTKYTCKIKFMK